MRRHILRGIALLIGVVSVWWGGVLLLNSTVFSAQQHLLHYLEALESNEREIAAALSGWDGAELAVVAESISEPEVIGQRRVDPTTREVRASFMLGGEQTTSEFTVERAPSLLGVFHQWQFATPPVSVIEVRSDATTSALIGGVEVHDSGRLELLVPGSYVVQSRTPWVRYQPGSIALDKPGGSFTLDLRALPTAALEVELEGAVSDYLETCVAQKVLQPSSCPFGVTIVDRVVGTPQWRISQMPRLNIAPGGSDGSWIVTGEGGVASVSADVQSLFDGSIEGYAESLEFEITATISGLDSEKPQLRID